MKFRKKPVVIEAEKFTGTDESICRIQAMLRKNKSVAVRVGKNFIQIQTLEGMMTPYIGDWIICGIAGELYPCKPDIFEATYEAVNP